MFLKLWEILLKFPVFSYFFIFIFSLQKPQKTENSIKSK